ncbi:MAG: hypothetical protein OXC44_03880 [Proteobacteria bacterium]|nr:hypothetical protein [Pseudomonadota bacterium]
MHCDPTSHKQSKAYTLSMCIVALMMIASSGDFKGKAYGGLEGATIATGPISLGMGGANPPSLNNVEHQLTFIFPHSEVVLALSPGIFYAWRSSLKDAYLSIGGGLVTDAYGLGLGATIGFGYYLFCLGVCLSLEYRQAIGINFLKAGKFPNQKVPLIDIQVPYTIKLGMTVFM